MMFKCFSELIYKNIIEIEVAILHQYKIDPFQLFSKMSVMDFQSYTHLLSDQVKKSEEAKKQNTGNLMKSLISIRDILNYMTGNY